LSRAGVSRLKGSLGAAGGGFDPKAGVRTR